ncbi:hypothetical protein OXPF_23060 [Oxobacter pfennigii]|uniref:Uncharacterized protein n=1 Tax=Oxobacter pfennigii TaxID=36849 RepID=A0A0P8YAT6_9CLOT|nr:hypothetical protein [Oxobacter pfennigii]KPU44139.1 hypothetical protein OXPF_23060 [Oxobacter pfennigii]
MMKLLNKPVEIICIFSKEGSITPFKMRMEDDNKNTLVYAIKPISVDKTKTLLNFHCTADMNGSEKKCNLHYYVAEMKWILYSML